MMRNSNDILIAAEEVRSNFIKTVILLVLMVGCVLALSWLLGTVLGNVGLGLKIGFLVCLIVIPLEMMASKFVVLSLADCSILNLQNPSEKRLLQIVEGISISAGLSNVPEVLLVNSKIPNAFAAGWNEENAVIGVTKGLLETMDEQELSGIISHEMSHIIHRDIMVCQMAIALNISIFLLAVIIRVASLFGVIKNKNNPFAWICVIIFFIVQPISMVIGLMLQAALSQKREFAADAMAVRLCSYNEGLCRALEKLKIQYPVFKKEQINELGGIAMESLYFYFPAQDRETSHPPVDERIKKLKKMY